MNQSGFDRLLVVAVLLCLGFGIIASGCGTVQEGTEEDWTNTPPFSVTARLEYRIDSLMNENRKLQQQYEAMASENRNLSARNAELEARSREAAAMPRPPTTTPAVQPGAPPRSTGRVTYEAALEKYRARKFQEAIDDFKQLVSGGVAQDLLDNCHYWIGESYFGMKKYNEAIQHFEVVAGMPASDKADDAQYMIGNSFAQVGKKQAAKDAFNKLMQQYPGSPLIGRAKLKLNSL